MPRKRRTPTPTTDAPAPVPAPAPTPSGAAYWGGRLVYTINGVKKAAPWDSIAFDTFESHAGKQISYVQFGQPFCQIDTNLFTICRNRGAIPHLEQFCRLGDGTQLTVMQIAQGAADGPFRSMCDKVRAWGYPVVFRWMWEPNGPWMETLGGLTYAHSRPDAYVAAWRRLHGIAQSAGATNMTWLWCPNWWRTGTSAKEPTPWWPGDVYVDAIGIDGYSDGYTLDKIMEFPYPWVTSKLNGKPFYFETGCIEAGVTGVSHPPPPGWSKAQWINDLFARLPNYPAIDVFQWFNDPASKTEIETSSEAQAAFRAGISDDRFLATAPQLPAMTKVPAL
jgi:hypothetical protein